MDVSELTEVLNDDSMAVEARLKFCLSTARRYLNAERGCLMITRTGYETMMHDGDEDLNLKFPFSRHVVGEVMTRRSGLVSFQSPGQLQGDAVASMQAHGVRAALCAPLLGPNDEDYGIIYFDTRLGREFSEDHLARIEELASAISSILV